MAKNTSRIFLVKRSDKGKVANGVSKLKTQGQGTVKSNILIAAHKGGRNC